MLTPNILYTACNYNIYELYHCMYHCIFLVFIVHPTNKTIDGILLLLCDGDQSHFIQSSEWTSSCNFVHVSLIFNDAIYYFEKLFFQLLCTSFLAKLSPYMKKRLKLSHNNYTGLLWDYFLFSINKGSMLSWPASRPTKLLFVVCLFSYIFKS